MTRIKCMLFIVLISTLMLSGCEKIKNIFDWQESNQGHVNVVIPSEPNGRVAMLLPDFTQLVDRYGTAVVNIQAVREVKTHESIHANNNNAETRPLPGDDPSFDFFHRLIPDKPKQDADSEKISFGSGFIISSDGYILTNAHVVMSSGIIKVKMTDKREFSAQLIGMDQRSDVAVLKIKANNLPVVKIGDPLKLRVGEWVAAIGAPFGFDNSVTAGIVSAKGRSLPEESYVPFIQTDVAINPGNSGGPLFNLKGEVIGINSQIYSRSGGFMGISFAIPIDVAMEVAEQIKKTGIVRRGQLGIYIQEVSQGIAESFNLDRPRGALVVRVTKNGPGEMAGIKVGDIILRLNGSSIENSKDLPMMTGSLMPGAKVKLLIWRKSAEHKLTVTLGELNSDNKKIIIKPKVRLENHQLGKLGVSLAELNETQKKEVGLSGGLVVMQVSGLASQSGLTRGDIIIGVGQQVITNFKSFEKAMTKIKDGSVLPILIRRGENTLFIALKLD